MAGFTPRNQRCAGASHRIKHSQPALTEAQELPWNIGSHARGKRVNCVPIEQFWSEADFAHFPLLLGGELTIIFGPRARDRIAYIADTTPDLLVVSLVARTRHAIRQA